MPGLRDTGHFQDPVSVLLVGFGYRENRVKLDPQVPYKHHRAGHTQGLELERPQRTLSLSGSGKEMEALLTPLKSPLYLISCHSLFLTDVKNLNSNVFH